MMDKAFLYGKKYDETSGHDKIALVYTLEKRVYVSLIDKIVNLPLKIENRIDENGENYQTLRLAVKQIDLLRLRDKGAALLGWAKDIFNGNENRGKISEQILVNKYHAELVKAGTAYNENGDLIIGGERIQVKYQNATVTTLATIDRVWNEMQGR